MWKVMKVESWAAGLQWLFFLFTNTVVIPVTIGQAFGLEQVKIISLLQLSFFFTGLACIVQALLGHRRSVMEGQSGLWWGVILSLCYAAPAQGIPLPVVGGSLSVGIILSGIFTVFMGLSGLSRFLAKWFTAGVMAVFTFLLAVRLNTIFLKGMLGIPFGASASPQINMPVFLLSSAVVLLIILLSVRGKGTLGRYSLLIGIVLGWAAYALLFDTESIPAGSTVVVDTFLLGAPAFDTGIIITAFIAGVLNMSNTFGALKGTDALYGRKTTNAEYRRSFTVSGVFVMISGLFGMVPYAPYVSSIGFLQQTRILDRLPFILSGLMFMAMGAVPAIGNLMAKLPLSVGSAALLVAYMRLLNTSLAYFAEITMTTANLYRLAVPLFVGIIFMAFPADYFQSVPVLIRPLFSNGLLIGILLALILENVRFAADASPRPKEKQAVKS